MAKSFIISLRVSLPSAIQWRRRACKQKDLQCNQEKNTKDLLDGDRVQALDALNKYQASTKSWRDKAIIPMEFAEEDLVLIRTARTESKGKLKPK